jgi:hypothetical protein
VQASRDAAQLEKCDAFGVKLSVNERLQTDACLQCLRIPGCIFLKGGNYQGWSGCHATAKFSNQVYGPNASLPLAQRVAIFDVTNDRYILSPLEMLFKEQDVIVADGDQQGMCSRLTHAPTSSAFWRINQEPTQVPILSGASFHTTMHVALQVQPLMLLFLNA